LPPLFQIIQSAVTRPRHGFGSGLSPATRLGSIPASFAVIDALFKTGTL
jgi:hypothetical protein